MTAALSHKRGVGCSDVKYADTQDVPIEAQMDDELQDFYEFLKRRHLSGDQKAVVALTALHHFLVMEEAGGWKRNK
jgi:hypothetical protein